MLVLQLFVHFNEIPYCVNMFGYVITVYLYLITVKYYIIVDLLTLLTLNMFGLFTFIFLFNDDLLVGKPRSQYDGIPVQMLSRTL